MNSNQLSIGIDEVLVLGVGVLLDFLINLAKVLSGDGGVVTASIGAEWPFRSIVR